MWKTELLNVPQTLTFRDLGMTSCLSSPSSFSVTRSCLSISSIWFTSLYIVSNSISYSLSS
ncbi:hypothetical protein E2C01_028744 [Portunus trituberculatus]|uniref:Uncharacterized protein n=1 Tax=Portunus trituberculatus TaxID=210409 RepID=A0A5B7EMB8_PORTR|nr:hypothetical protein [Portunus trituberculatus]